MSGKRSQLSIFGISWGQKIKIIYNELQRARDTYACLGALAYDFPRYRGHSISNVTTFNPGFH